MTSNALEISNYYKTSLCHPDIKKIKLEPKSIHYPTHQNTPKPLPQKPLTASNAHYHIPQSPHPWTAHLSIKSIQNCTNLVNIMVQALIECCHAKELDLIRILPAHSGSYLWVQNQSYHCCWCRFKADFDFANCSTVSLLLWFEVRPSQGVFYTSQ